MAVVKFTTPFDDRSDREFKATGAGVKSASLNLCGSYCVKYDYLYGFVPASFSDTAGKPIT